ncbi:hypothetical protein AAMO2058_000124200 [Amorphochlora amoebiformis]
MNVLRTLGALVLISHHLALGCEKSFDKDNGDGHLIRKILKFRTGVPREIGEDKSYDLHETRDSEPRGAVSQGLVGLRGGGDNSEKSMGFMRAVTIERLRGDLETDLQMRLRWPRPRNPEKGEVLVRVLACSLAPGDLRVHRGDCDYFQAPPSFPYIPGGDICGKVVKVGDPATSKFKKGDTIISIFNMAPRNGLAQYALVKESIATKKPTKATPIQASGLPSSALAAMCAIEKNMRKGDRVLIIGGSGGVGSHLIQLAKAYGASYVAATSTATDLLLKLGADRAIDYRSENWWEIPEYQTREGKFDIIIDTVGGISSWKRAKTCKCVKNGFQGGRYATTCGDQPYLELHGVVSLFWWLIRCVFSRDWWTRLWRFVPKWTYTMMDMDGEKLQRLCGLVDEGSVQAIVDPTSPFPFSREGVLAALKLQDSRRNHGKVVVKVSQPWHVS